MFIFVADLFKEQYTGGAELTFGSLIDSINLPAQKIMSDKVSVELMEQHKDRFWIFGNYAHLSPRCLMYAVKNLNYSIVEFDYKYCRNRSEHICIQKHGACNCADTLFGKLRAIFIAKSKATFWMSREQLTVWIGRFPPLEHGNNIILSSVFQKDNLNFLLSLDTSQKNNKWIILGSNSWIKGQAAAVKYAKENNLEYETVWGLEYRDLLAKLAKSKGLVHLPHGHDTCPRMVIEAKLLGCKLIINENVQHRNEEWFTGDRHAMLEYLQSREGFFCDTIYSVNGSNLPVVKDEVASHIHFSVVVPSYNCAQWAERAVRSILNQDYENYTVYFVDDASTDNTEQLIQGVLESYPEEVKSRFNYRKNPENRKALYNICRAIEQGPDDTVIVLLDGDDYLSSKNVLSFLNKTYSNENVWLSTGSYVETGTGRVVKSLEVPEEAWALGIRNFQEPPGHPNIFSHLRTFRKDLYSKINPEDLLDEDGEHYKCTFDRALMYPMIEMSGPEHHEIIDKVLYVYNRQNPLSVDRVDRQNQLRIEQHLRSGEPYERIRL